MSYNFKDFDRQFPDADIAATGKGVLDIWNARVNENPQVVVLARYIVP